MKDSFEDTHAFYGALVSLLEANNNNSTNCSMTTTSIEVDTALNSTHVFFNILYCITSILALSGNVIVLIVQLCCYRLKPLQNLKKYLINLALSDILFGALCVPFMYTDFTLGQWLFPNWLCPTAQYVQLCSVCVNSSTLMIIGIERYCAVLCPFSGFYHWLKSYAYYLVASTWIFGLVYTYMPTRYTAVEKIITSNTTYYRCANYIGLSVADRRALIVGTFVTTFGIPALVLIVTYTAIVRYHIKRGKSLKETNCNSEPTKNPTKTKQPVKSAACSTSSRITNRFIIRNNTKAIRITLAIIVLYGLCWLPVKVFILLFEFGFIKYCTVRQYYFQQYLYIGLHWLAMAHSFVNPIVYTFSSQRFRVRCWDIFIHRLLRQV